MENKQVKELKNKTKYKLSICMIVRDEKKFLDNCLKSLKPLMDLEIAELIVVDTGSVDNTVEIAKKYTDKVYFKKWNNNFSEARNYSISLATGEYIFIMDADQEMEYSEVKKLIDVFSGNEYKKYNSYSLVYKNFTKEDLSEYTFFSLNLIFKNDGTFRYEGNIHNQPVYKGPEKNLEIYMLHYGYIMTEDIKEKKFKRTATMLKKEIEKDPKNIYYMYQLSRSYEMHGDTKEALIELENYLSLMETEEVNDNFRINYYHNAAIIYFNAKEYDKSIEYCIKMKKLDNKLIDCYYLLGKCYVIKGNIDRAVSNLKLYLLYLNTFRYEKYAKTNGLEVFSFGYKYQVISELFRFKIRVNQHDGMSNYINPLMEDFDTMMMLLGDIIKECIIGEDIKSLDNIIKSVKSKDETLVLIYLLSITLAKLKDEDIELIIDNIRHLTNEEKFLLKDKINKEKISPFNNLIDYIMDNVKESNRTIKVENCIFPMIETLSNADIKDILKCDYKNEIIFIIEYLLSKCDMIVNSYVIDENWIFKLLYNYEDLIINVEDKDKEESKRLVKCLDEFALFSNNKEYVKAIAKLKEAIEIKKEFSNLIAMIKDYAISKECLEESSIISKDDILKIKENLITLINSNMIKEANDLFSQLESLYNIKNDVDLISIKCTLYFYDQRYEEAEEIIEEGLKIYHGNMDLLYNLVYIYESKGMNLSALNVIYKIKLLPISRDIEEVLDKSIFKLNKLVPII